MKTIELQIPDQFDIDNNELKTFMAVKLFEVAKLTLSQAAEMAGVSIENFTSILFKYNVSVFNYPASDLESDVRNATESIRRHK
jgi:predicted HTH domain antitoxin